MDNANVDPQLVQMLQAETQKARFQQTVHSLADQCWDICVPDRPGSKLDSKTETCVNNCVNRFIDASKFIVQIVSERSMSAHQSGGLLH